MKIKQQDLKVLSNKKIAPGHYVIELESEVLCKAAPGQFVQILTDHDQDPLLPRPFSFLDTGKKTLRILYQVVGKGTRLMSLKTPGSALRILGPLGNGFSMSWKRTPSNIVVIGGGVGIPPLYHLVKTFVEKPSLGIKKDQIHVFLGARTKDFLHCEQDLKKLGVHLNVATDDGSKGHQGVVTELADKFLSSTKQIEVMIYACGPTPMLKSSSVLAREHGVRCELSVEEPMPCGFGACLGCAVKIKDGKGYRFAMSCTEGPVFQADEILWD